MTAVTFAASPCVGCLNSHHCGGCWCCRAVAALITAAVMGYDLPKCPNCSCCGDNCPTVGCPDSCPCKPADDVVAAGITAGVR